MRSGRCIICLLEIYIRWILQWIVSLVIECVAKSFRSYMMCSMSKEVLVAINLVHNQTSIYLH